MHGQIHTACTKSTLNSHFLMHIVSTLISHILIERLENNAEIPDIGLKGWKRRNGLLSEISYKKLDSWHMRCTCSLKI